MRYCILASLTLLMLLTCAGQADAHPKKNGPFGLGVILYEPTGLTGKYFMTSDQALDFHIGLDGLGNDHGDEVGFYVDYLFHFDMGVNTPYFAMPLYLGPGGALIFDDDDRYCTKWECYDRDEDLYLMARMPLGLSFLFTRFGGEAFIELALQMLLIPDIDLDLDAALGFRYYF